MARDHHKAEKSKSKKRKHEDKKKKKKKLKKHRNRSRSNSISDSDNDKCLTPVSISDQHLQMGLKILNELLDEFPSLASEFLHLLKMLDDGQSIVLDGLENRKVRDYLVSFFSCIGLVKGKQGEYAFYKQSNLTTHLTTTFSSLLEKRKSTQVEETVLPEETSEYQVMPPPVESSSNTKVPDTKRVLGPQLPTRDLMESYMESNDDEDMIGPSLPGEAGCRIPTVDPDEEERVQERKQWEQLRQAGKGTLSSDGIQKLKREEWMINVPQGNSTLDALRPSQMKHRQFRANAAPEVDKTWFASPEERTKAEQERAEMELLGYVKNPSKSLSTHSSKLSDATDQSIMPVVNPKADAEIREKMEQLHQLRGKSLLEVHKEKQLQQKKNDTTTKYKGWNRETDLVKRPNLTSDQADALIKQGSQLSSRFSQPKITRQFL